MGKIDKSVLTKTLKMNEYKIDADIKKSLNNPKSDIEKKLFSQKEVFEKETGNYKNKVEKNLYKNKEDQYKDFNKNIANESKKAKIVDYAKNKEVYADLTNKSNELRKLAENEKNETSKKRLLQKAEYIDSIIQKRLKEVERKADLTQNKPSELKNKMIDKTENERKNLFSMMEIKAKKQIEQAKNNKAPNASYVQQIWENRLNVYNKILNGTATDNEIKEMDEKWENMNREYILKGGDSGLIKPPSEEQKHAFFSLYQGKGGLSDVYPEVEVMLDFESLTDSQKAEMMQKTEKAWFTNRSKALNVESLFWDGDVIEKEKVERFYRWFGVDKK